ncbi:MAG TPA: hypothetical protein VGP83_08235 [Pyrinomonadaceae bacterium]|jgi:hypothetical protein|nr:hypothetical protein [Pyrinomonadaceae bacterium]
MRRELGLLNIICIFVAFGFLVLAGISVISSGDFLTIDNLFIITVSLVMALMFIISPLLYLKSQGRLPIPGMKKSVPAPAGGGDWGQIKSHAAQAPPLLDAKGRAVPPDVRAIVAQMDSHKEKTPNVV